MVSLPSGRVVLARHATPGGELQLQQRPLSDGSLAFEIISDGVFLMAPIMASSFGESTPRPCIAAFVEEVSRGRAYLPIDLSCLSRCWTNLTSMSFLSPAMAFL